MKVVRVVGPSDSGKTTLVERLAGRLSERGRVGTVKHVACEPTLDTDGTDTARHRDAGAAETYGIANDGSWFATGEDRSLTDALEELSVDCDYALVEGYGDLGSGLATVVLGTTDGQADPRPDDRPGTAANERAADSTDDGQAVDYQTVDGSAVDDPTDDGSAVDDPTDGDSTRVLASAPTADDVDLDAVLDALDDVDPCETLASLVARAKESDAADRAGAIATFTGRVRERDDPGDEPTEHLEYERYDEVAAERTRRIRDELAARDGVFEVLLHHRTGVVEAGEDAVHVVVLAGHRAEAFATVEDGIDRLKDEVPLFKKEVTVSGEFWAHDRPE